MTTYNDAIAYPLPAQPSFAARLARRVTKRIDGWLHRQAVRSELESLDLRTLSDIGINRGDFPSIIAGTYRHPRDL